MKMYQTKRLESDMTQESLLQQCTLDSKGAKVHNRDENVRERDRRIAFALERGTIEGSVNNGFPTRRGKKLQLETLDLDSRLIDL